MDLEQIQQYYDNVATSWREVSLKFDISVNKLFRLSLSGKLRSRSKTESILLNFSKNPPRVLSEETKQKISISRKKFLKENPDMVPYKLNHKHKKISYPEQYFIECFQDKFIHQYMFDSYTLDFADIENKLDIEIDGCQHRLDPKIVNHDLKRNTYLTEHGWNVLRINWSIFKSLPPENQRNVVGDILQDIIPNSSSISFYTANTAISNAEFMINIQRLKNRNICPICGSRKCAESINCSKCANKNKVCKIPWPSVEEMSKMIWEIPATRIAQNMGISDNAVIKFCRKHNISKPERGYWQKLYGGDTESRTPNS